VSVIDSFSASDYAAPFDNEMTRILDLYAPIRSATRRCGTHDAYQLTSEARSAKRNCRRLERRYRRTQAVIDKEFERARDLARSKIEESRTNFIREKLSASNGDPRQMWRTTTNLLHSNPPFTLNDDQCETMSLILCTFSVDKVNRIHASIMTVVQSLNSERFKSRQFIGLPMDSFSDVEPSDVRKLIEKLPNKSSPRDVLLTSLLHSCVDVFSPITANLANISFRFGEFPSIHKTAHVHPS
jgi:hypothetical protein